jgi:hypothetical protein
MNISIDHHILPKFYLSGFTNSEGKLAIFDHLRKRSKGFYSPSTHFFEKGRNWVELNGKNTDIPEKLYSRIDSETARIFKKIQSCLGVPKLSAYEMNGLQFFLSTLFWRNPQSDAHYNAIYKNTRFIKRFLSAIDPKTGDLMTKGLPESILKDDNIVQKLFRPLAGPMSFEFSDQDYKNWKISYSASGDLICSDNPFFFVKPPKQDIFDAEFIFPLTKNHLLIKVFKFREPNDLPGYIVGLIQLALFSQAKKYSACPTKETLNILSKVPENYSLDFLRDQIFGTLSLNHHNPFDSFLKFDLPKNVTNL